MHSSILNRYKESAIETASPSHLILMLYDGAIKFAKQAEEAVRSSQIEATNRALGRAQDILVELMSSLRVDVGEVARNLFAVYDYLNRRLVEANIKKDAEIIREVLGHLMSLRDAWSQVARNTRSTGSGETVTAPERRGKKGEEKRLTCLNIEI